VTVWIAKAENVRNGHRIQIYQGEDPVSFGAYLKLLEEDQRFASWFTDLLAGADYEAFFWEHPPLNDANIDSGVEFVLLDSPDPIPSRSVRISSATGTVKSSRFAVWVAMPFCLLPGRPGRRRPVSIWRLSCVRLHNRRLKVSGVKPAGRCAKT
jgi:hypothetical protein